MTIPESHTNKKIVRAEQMASKAKIRQGRLSRIRGIIQGIPSKPSFEIWEEDYERGYDKGRAELAAQIREVLNGDPFEMTAEDLGRFRSRSRRANRRHLQKLL